MEKLTAIGRRYLNFKGKDGNPVEGVQLFCTQPAKEEKDGFIGEKFFVNARSDMYAAAMALQFPCVLNANFNRWGKVDNFTVEDPGKK